MLKELALTNAYRVTPTGLYLVSTAYQGNYSREVIEKSGEFVVNVCSQNQLHAVDKSRDLSGRNVEDKFVALGLETLPAK